jgi:hypothetical protein
METLTKANHSSKLKTFCTNLACQQIMTMAPQLGYTNYSPCMAANVMILWFLHKFNSLSDQSAIPWTAFITENIDHSESWQIDKPVMLTLMVQLPCWSDLQSSECLHHWKRFTALRIHRKPIRVPLFLKKSSSNSTDQIHNPGSASITSKIHGLEFLIKERASSSSSRTIGAWSTSMLDVVILSLNQEDNSSLNQALPQLPKENPPLQTMIHEWSSMCWTSLDG